MCPHSCDARSWGFKRTPHVTGIATTIPEPGAVGSADPACPGTPGLHVVGETASCTSSDTENQKSRESRCKLTHSCLLRTRPARRGARTPGEPHRTRQH